MTRVVNRPGRLTQINTSNLQPSLLTAKEKCNQREPPYFKENNIQRSLDYNNPSSSRNTKAHNKLPRQLIAGETGQDFSETPAYSNASAIRDQIKYLQTQIIMMRLSRIAIRVILYENFL